MAFPPHPHVHLIHAFALGLALVTLLGTAGDGAPEEAFAAFAREGVVVVAGSVVAANHAQLLLGFGGGGRGGRRGGAIFDDGRPFFAHARHFSTTTAWEEFKRLLNSIRYW